MAPKILPKLFSQQSQFFRKKVLPNGNIKSQFARFNKSTGILELETSMTKGNGAFVYNSVGERNLFTGVTGYFGHYDKNWLELGVPEEFATFRISNLT